MKLILTILFCLTFAFGQKTFVIDDFSKEYFAKVTISSSKEENGGVVISSGWLSVYRKNSTKELLKTAIKDVWVSRGKNGKLEQQPAQGGYFILFDDYDFDGREDVAVRCNGDFYLAQSDNSLKYSKVYSEIFGRYDYLHTEFLQKEKLIEKYEQYGIGDGTLQGTEYYQAQNGTPEIVKANYLLNVWESPYLLQQRVETWENGKLKSIQKYGGPDIEPEVEVVLSFTAEHNGKQIIVSMPPTPSDMNLINYTLINPDKEYLIECEFPESCKQSKGYGYQYPESNLKQKLYLTKSPDRLELSFGNKTAHYTIVENLKTKEVGMDIVTGGKSYHWKAKPGTVSGSLKKVLEMQKTYGQIENLVVK